MDGKETILIADDADLNRAILRNLFEDEYNLLEAENGEQALIPVSYTHLPNLCTGGYNFHGKYEFIPVQSMEKVVELLLKIVEKFAER